MHSLLGVAEHLAERGLPVSPGFELYGLTQQPRYNLVWPGLRC